MNKEIKEILDKLKLLCYDNYCLEFSVDYIERKEEKLLLDYITNLQECYNDNVNRYEELIEKYSNLQEENEKLNTVIETLKETNHLLINQKYKLEYELDKLDELKDKAIEIIKLCNSKCAKEVINILQGSDKE